jgi:hypothetical protein
VGSGRATPSKGEGGQIVRTNEKTHRGRKRAGVEEMEKCLRAE